MKLKIISGGQTGADLAGLWVAKTLNIPTGGMAPSNYFTQNGPQPKLKEFGLKAKGSYRQRTIANVSAADLTLIFAKYPNSAGTKLTSTACLKLRKQSIIFEDTRLNGESFSDFYNHGGNEEAINDTVALLMQFNNILLPDEYLIINVAGNSTSRSNDSFEFTFVSLWCTLMLYYLNVDDTESNAIKLIARYGDVDLLQLALKLKDKFE